MSSSNNALLRHCVRYALRHRSDASPRRGRGGEHRLDLVAGPRPETFPSPAYDAAKAGVIRLTTALGWLRDREGIRVNCLVPDWVATLEVRSYVDSLSPQQRKQQGVPDVLLTLEQISDAVVWLATDDSLAGRVMVWWCGQPPRLIPIGDPGYASFE